MDKKFPIIKKITKNMLGLEFGPSFNPLFKKSDGWNIKIIDHETKEGLVNKYKEDKSVDVKKIEDVDYVWRGGNILDNIPRELHGSFDYCVASHVVEHIPDLLDFIISVQKVIKPEGLLYLIVPDKRYCFDYFKSLTLTSDILFAHSNSDRRHSKKTAFENFAYNVKNGSEIAWNKWTGNNLEFCCLSLNDSYQSFLKYDESNDLPYVDFHTWKFTPNSFNLIFLELKILGLIDLKVEEEYDTIGCEFYKVLKFSQNPLEKDKENFKRMEYFKKMLAEISEPLTNRKSKFFMNIANNLIRKSPIIKTLIKRAIVFSKTRRIIFPKMNDFF